MKLDPAALLESSAPATGSGLARGWPFALALIAIAGMLAAYAATIRPMVSMWATSASFAHGFLIMPISAWLIWRCRGALATVGVRPNILALPLLGVVGFVWLLGHLGAVEAVQQYCMVLMIPLLVWAILGNETISVLAFPLFFLLFAVPTGEFLLPTLMEHTADFTVAALRLSGIPVYREGQFFTLPSGSWSVVEACSGLRYLIASITLGCLYAYLTYRSLARRAIFVAFSILVPILANWLRAYIVVMIGHLSSMKYAVGVDHLVYGWIFFGVIMLVFFWIGSWWREDLASEQTMHVRAMESGIERPSLRPMAAAFIAGMLMVLVWPLAAARLDNIQSSGTVVLQGLPPAGGWQPVTEPLTQWTPHFLNPATELSQVYAKNGERAGLYIAYYRQQRQGAELVSSLNTLVLSTDMKWGNIGETKRTVEVGTQKIPVIEAHLRGPSTRLLVWRSYWVDNRYTANPYWVKLSQVKSRLLGHPDTAAVVIVYTRNGERSEQAAKVLQDLFSSMQPAIGAGLTGAR